MNQKISEADTLTIEYLGTTVSMFLPDHETDHVQKQIWNNGDFYEKRMLRDMLSRVSGGTFIDVGANIGNHTVFAATFLDVRVVAIEPEPYCFDLLQSQVALNELQDKVVLHNAAAGDAAGFCRTVTADSSNIGMTTIVSADEGIPIFTVDSLNEANVSVIKVDVEGYEEQVLIGAQRTIDDSRPLLYVECGDEQKYSRTSRLLASYGYAAVAQYNATPTYLFMHLDQSGLFDAFRTQLLNSQEFMQQHVDRKTVAITEEIERSDDNLKGLADSIKQLADSLAESQAEAERLREEVRSAKLACAEHEATVVEQDQKIHRLEESVVLLKSQVEDAKRAEASLKRTIQHQEQRLDERKARIANMTSSVSWRVTSPLRWMSRSVGIDKR